MLRVEIIGEDPERVFLEAARRRRALDGRSELAREASPQAVAD
jgi:hypothetical protein